MSLLVSLPEFPDCLATTEKAYELYLRSCENVVASYCKALGGAGAAGEGLRVSGVSWKQLAAGVRHNAGTTSGDAAGGSGFSPVSAEFTTCVETGGGGIGSSAGPVGRTVSGGGVGVRGPGSDSSDRGRELDGSGPGSGGLAVVSEQALANQRRRARTKKRKAAKKAKALAAAPGGSGVVACGVDEVLPDRESGGASELEWRRGSAAGSMRAGGYFADLPDDVQRELRETRARALIARNKREEREHVERVSSLDSPEAIFMKAMGLLDIAERAAKKANDSKVAGWVAAIATSHSETIAKSGGFSGVASFDSKTSFDSAGSAKAKKAASGPRVALPKKRVVPVAKWPLKEHPANRYESMALGCGALTCVELEGWRVKVGRQLVERDFYEGPLAQALSTEHVTLILGAGLNLDEY